MFSSFHFSSPPPPSLLPCLVQYFLNRSTLHSIRFLPFYPPAKNVSCRNTKKGINQCVVNFYTVGKRLIINFRLIFFQFFLACFMYVCICRRCHYFLPFFVKVFLTSSATFKKLKINYLYVLIFVEMVFFEIFLTQLTSVRDLGFVCQPELYL